MESGYASPAPYRGAASDVFCRDRYLLNQKVMSLGSKYFVYGEAGEHLLFVDRPVFRLQAHVGIYTDEGRSTKVLTVFQDSAWAIINHSFTLQDETGQPIAYLKRQGWISLLRRTWRIFDTYGSLVAIAQEDSW